MIFNKAAKTAEWGKEQSFQQKVLGKLDIHIKKKKKIKLDLYLMPGTKINSN